MTWLSLHFGLEWSSILESSLKNRAIVIELVFDYENERNNSPLVSKAANIDILGFKFLTAILLLFPLYSQFIFLKSVVPIHDSSTLIIVLP